MTNDGEWCPDPYARHELRWWNGTQFTDDVHDDGVTSVDVLGDGSVMPDQTITAAPGPHGLHSPAPAPASDTPPVPEAPSVPFGQEAPHPLTPPEERRSSRGRWIWAGAGLVLLVAIAAGVVLALGGGGDDEDLPAIGVDQSVGVHQVDLRDGEVIRVRVEGQEASQDLQLAYGTTLDQAVAEARTHPAVFGDVGNGTAAEVSALYAEEVDAFLAVSPAASALPVGVDTVLTRVDLRDDAVEADWFVSFGDGTYSVLVSDVGGATGDYRFVIERFGRLIDIDREFVNSPEIFDDLVDNDPFFNSTVFYDVATPYSG